MAETSHFHLPQMANLATHKRLCKMYIVNDMPDIKGPQRLFQIDPSKHFIYYSKNPFKLYFTNIMSFRLVLLPWNLDVVNFPC